MNVANERKCIEVADKFPQLVKRVEELEAKIEWFEHLANIESKEQAEPIEEDAPAPEESSASYESIKETFHEAAEKAPATDAGPAKSEPKTEAPKKTRKRRSKKHKE